MENLRQVETPASQRRPEQYSARYNLRVLQLGKFYAPLNGGMETHLKALCDGLRDQVYLDVLVSNTERSNSVDYVDGVRVRRLSQWFKFAGASFCPGMIREIRASRADIVHIHWPNPTALLAYLASGHRGRLLITYHADTTRQRILGPLFEPILRYALRRSDTVIVSSQKLARCSRTLASVAARCVAVPFGIDLADYDRYSAAEVDAIRAHYGRPIILTVGRLVYYKGFEYLIEAMAGTDAVLLIIGEGPLLGPLQKAARAAGVADRVHFLGRVDRVVEYYRACDMFVLPSTERAEAFGLVQLEAMACGKPVVNTWVPSGVPVVSLNGVTGLTVAPKDSSALTEAIRLLLQDSELRLRYGMAARRRVEKEFTVDGMIARTLDLYLSPPSTVLDEFRRTMTLHP